MPNKTGFFLKCVIAGAKTNLIFAADVSAVNINDLCVRID